MTEIETPCEDMEPYAEHAHLLAPGPAQSFLAIVRPIVADLGYHLVRIRLTGDGAAPILQIMAERDDGMLDIDDCETISHAVSPVLDVEDPISGEYALEVSSPGMARPLTRPIDFQRWVGEEAKIELQQPVEGQKRFRGRLAGFEAGEALLETIIDGQKTPQILGFSLPMIAEARLVISDHMLKSALKAGKSAQQAKK
jgi:ribosome maturation factor RimP